jgi:hypothetical protein
MGAEKWLDIEIWNSPAECFSALKKRGYRIATTCLGTDSVIFFRCSTTYDLAVFHFSTNYDLVVFHSSTSYLLVSLQDEYLSQLGNQ